MPQSATETKPTIDELHAAWEKARTCLNDAAGCLAYDLTFRAEDEYNGQHERPSKALTARLKAKYRAAHAAELAAFDAWRNGVNS